LPSSLAFGTVNIGSFVSQTFTLCNGTSSTGSTCNVPALLNVTISGIAVTLDPAEFIITNNTCPTVIASGGTCAITVSYSPINAGSDTGTVTITSSAAGSPQTVGLTGTAASVTAPTLSSIALAPSSASITTSSPTNIQQLTATETFSDSSTQNATNYGLGWSASGGSSSSPQTLLNSTVTGRHTLLTSNSAPSINTTNGSLIACFAGITTSAGGTQTVTDTLGNSYVATSIATDHGSVINTQWFYTTNGSVGADIITQHASVASTVEMACLEYSGTSGTVDVVKAGNNAGAATVNITTGSFTTTGGSDLILNGAIDYGAQNCSISPDFVPTGSYSMVAQDWSGANCGPMGVAAWSSVASGSHAGTMTNSIATTSWQAYAITFFTSSTVSVASVNSTGQVLGLTPGTSTISVNPGAVNNGNVCGNGNSLTGQLSLSCTFRGAIGSKDTVVCSVSSSDTSSSYSLPTDSSGNTYVLASPAASPPSRGTGVSQALYYSQGVAAAATDTVTANFGSGGASSPSMVCADMLGLVGGVDVQGVATGNNLNPTNTLTAGAASDVIFSGVVAPVYFPNSQTLAQLIGKVGHSEMQRTDLFGSGAYSDIATLNFGDNWLMNSVMFKSISLGTATITVSNSVASTYSINNQQPVTTKFFPGGIFTTPLPADASSHCLTNVSCSSSDPSIAIVNNITGSSDSAGGLTIQQTTANITNSQGNGFYYASANDPVYRVNAGSGPCATGFNATAANCAAGKYFHMPAGAQYDACTNDEDITIWDQSTDIDPTPGGRFVGGFFENNGSCSPFNPPVVTSGCTATTPAQADSQTACQLAWYYNSVSYPFNDPFGGWGNGISSMGAAWTGQTREQELIGNAINHAIPLSTYCERSSAGNQTADSPAFPATGNARGCEFVDANRPLSGAWFYIDSGYNCSSLPAWQKPICVAMQTYGGFLHATGGSNFAGLVAYPMEGGVAHTVANVNDPYFNEPNAGGTTAWIITNGVTSCPGGGYPKTCTGTNGIEVIEDSATSAQKVDLFAFNMPGLITGHHLHILDTCLAKRVAGQPGGC
jgi:hypothetical protein